MKKNFIPKLTIILLPVLAISCKGSGSATTADSTVLYTGSISKLDSAAKKDSNAKDSINIGPDSFRADSVKRAQEQH